MDPKQSELVRMISKGGYAAVHLSTLPINDSEDRDLQLDIAKIGVKLTKIGAMLMVIETIGDLWKETKADGPQAMINVAVEAIEVIIDSCEEQSKASFSHLKNLTDEYKRRHPHIVTGLMKKAAAER